ncbi:MFS transporter [Clostridium omnivorum]|uniref:MFS transporter n=1 Tax=Clostridium omnivorum TaxID=1604902 RepID=A0ABQ5N0Y0_9CLOT|nr:MFS transporter [Clostridium sp. E14]GLC28853.1 MFS transporter [Clostridium sp. E14]
MNSNNSAKLFLKNNFHALTHKNFRYYWMGQCVSLIGTWMQNIGQSWLVLSLTGSPFLLGLVGTIQFLPITVFSLFAGVIIDKFPKKKILLFTQIVSMLLAFALSALVFTKTIKYQYIIILAFILGCNNTIDTPTRQSFTIEVAGKEDLMNAIALNSATFNLARIIGPAVGALLMAYLGAGWCFLFNGLSFIAVIYGLLQIKAVPYVRMKQKETGVLKEIIDGLKYIKGNKNLMQSILLTTIMGIFAFNYSVLIPVFTKNVLMMQEKTYGFLMSSLGVGSLIGALGVSLKSKRGPKMTAMIRSIVIVSILLICTGLTRYYYITALSLAVTGVFNIMFSTTANSTLQINSKDEYRGRVMSVYSLVFAGSTPIGNMFSGYTADKFGVSAAFILSGGIALTLLVIVVIIFRNKITDDEKLILNDI